MRPAARRRVGRVAWRRRAPRRAGGGGRAVCVRVRHRHGAGAHGRAAAAGQVAEVRWPRCACFFCSSFLSRLSVNRVIYI